MQFLPKRKHVRLSYKDQLVNAVQKNNRCLFRDSYDALGKFRSFLMLKQAVSIVAIVI
jgi:hypothetical protein